MAVPQLGHQRAVGLFDHPRGRRGGQDLSEGRTVDAVGAREIRPGSDQHSTPAAHIIRDVFKIERRQDAAAFVAVKDDQIEILDLFHEQFAGGKGDQRKFVHRHAILFFRRAQDREMHQIDRAV